MISYSMVTLHFHSRLGEKKLLAIIALFIVRILITKCFGGVFSAANFLIVGCALPHLLPNPLLIMHVGVLWDVSRKQAETMKRGFC